MEHKPERLLREPEVERRTGTSRTTRWRKVREGEFPAPVKLTSGNAIAWKESEVEAWIASRPRAVA